MGDQEGHRPSAGRAAPTCSHAIGTKLACSSGGWCDIAAAGSSKHALPASSGTWPHTSWGTNAASKLPFVTAANHERVGWIWRRCPALTARHIKRDRANLETVARL